ncbi:metal ABC transporter permease [Sulfurovum mangrovi]|uniref:metal ABC transporter permease n=1 Tax=Sulfurovum mangrovi TaxID=2893889 RepID=UPI001E4E3ACA|nr:metal ABC transporter permease [Sulfurovum mangrovi]UFH59749.1 metal ABC transporter permease [Sulfurovum mangrovi]UFH60550.1 metal ABC transporter permease [Sulfurovum mangrovi]
MQLIEILWPSFVLIIFLVFIHAILGIEIIKRGVIFTDLAIGQMAAVGMAISIGFLDGNYQTLLTLFFAILGALFVTYATRYVEHIEAFIGILYAFGASSIMILLSNSPQGTELFAKLSAVDILFVSPHELIIPVLLYSMIAIFMFSVYPKMTGMVRELSFFILLALTVTSSVQLAGVLVVFVLLVAPALIALSQQKFTPLYTAWGSGLFFSCIALVASYNFNLPTGYSIVFFQSLGVVGYFLLSARR